MKLHIGKLSWRAQAPPLEDGWFRVQSPGSRLGYCLAIGIGLLVIFLLLLWLIAVSVFAAKRGIEAEFYEGPVPWGAVIVAVLLSVPFHELLHAFWLPRMGLSPETILILRPKKLWFAVYYDGCLTRRRWLLMRLAPFVCLTLLTIGLLTLFQFIPAAYPLVIFLQILFLVNGLGSGGDIVAVFWVLNQVPSGAQICFINGKAYWRPDKLI